MLRKYERSTCGLNAHGAIAQTVGGLRASDEAPLCKRRMRVVKAAVAIAARTVQVRRRP
jgi:hypothetical protein